MSNINVDVDYKVLAQAIENCIWALNKLKDKLDIAAIEQGVKDKDES